VPNGGNARNPSQYRARATIVNGLESPYLLRGGFDPFASGAFLWEINTTKPARRHLHDGTLLWYDDSGSYYTGTHCPLAKFGHPRDAKRGTAPTPGAGSAAIWPYWGSPSDRRLPL
jgi:hypothetical protein